MGLRYGPRMFKVCSSNSQWLGKEAFSTLQAACFPEFFALQCAACLLSLGARIGTSGFDIAAIALTIATLLGLINLLFLGPVSMPLMMALYEPADTSDKEAALLPVKQAQKR